MYSTLQRYRISFKLTPTCPLHSIVPRVHPFCLMFKHFINSYSRSLTRDRVPIPPSRAVNLITVGGDLRAVLTHHVDEVPGVLLHHSAAPHDNDREGPQIGEKAWPGWGSNPRPRIRSPCSTTELHGLRNYEAGYCRHHTDMTS